MTEKLDYSREEAMEILNNQNYSDEEKRKLYDDYMNNLKKKRKNEIVSKLNGYAKDIPVITKDIYISKLKEYDNDDLSKPFEVIEKELSDFEKDMKEKYNSYLEEKNKVEQIEEEILPDFEVAKEVEEESFDDTIFGKPLSLSNETESDEVITPSLSISDEVSVLNEQSNPEDSSLFNDGKDEYIMPNELETDEKGNASAIILSIIAVIIGIVVMYSIIRLN